MPFPHRLTLVRRAGSMEVAFVVSSKLERGYILTKKSLLRVFALPSGILILGCIPVLNVILYSGHGGPFWLLLPLCFPYILVRLFIDLRRLLPPDRKRGLRMAGVSVLLYIVVVFPVTRWTERSVTSWSGLPIRPGTMFKLATLPVGFLLPPYHS